MIVANVTPLLAPVAAAQQTKSTNVTLSGSTDVGAASAAKPQPLPASDVVVTTTSDSGPGSLRQALIDAPVGGTITFSPSVTGEIFLTTGELQITKDVTIRGPGADVLSITGHQAWRVFSVGSWPSNLFVGASISGLTIMEGRADGGPDVEDGFGAGIMNWGELTLSDMVLTRNSARDGGGIWTCGRLTVTGTTLSENEAARGGGIFSDDIYCGGGGPVTVDGSTIELNSADILGAGIYVDHSQRSSPLAISASTIWGNGQREFGLDTPLAGGGIFIDRALTTITNSTISLNGSDPYVENSNLLKGGAGIFSMTLSLTITNSTIAGNLGGDGLLVAGGGAIVRNTILAANEAQNCRLDEYPFPGAFITDGGGNLSFPDASCGAGFASGDPHLGVLEDNGGPTWTYAIGLDGAARDAGDPAVCAAPAPDGAGGTDQRGASRGESCDIGAFELDDADLSVDMTAPSSATAGSVVVFLSKVSNAGPLADPNVVLTDTLPAGATFLSYTATQGTCVAPAKKSSVVRCELGSIDSGASQDTAVAIKVAMSQKGPLQNIVRVSGSRFDRNAANNTGVTVTKIAK